MLSDEEKKAIDLLKNIDKQKCVMLECPVVKNNIERQLKIIELNRTIRKQSKEIEHQIEKRENQRNELAILNAKQIEFNKLVNTVNSYKGQFKRQQKEIEELKEKNNKLMEELDLTTIYITGVYDGEKKVENKIKAKIEEVKDGTYDAKIVLQSLLLLEKE